MLAVSFSIFDCVAAEFYAFTHEQTSAGRRKPGTNAPGFADSKPHQLQVNLATEYADSPNQASAEQQQAGRFGCRASAHAHREIHRMAQYSVGAVWVAATP